MPEQTDNQRTSDRPLAAPPSSPLEWHRGPANGGEGSAGGDQWYDGHRLLVVVDTNGGEREYALVTVEADGYADLMIAEDEPWDWGVQDVSWWAKVEDRHLPPVNTELRSGQ